MTDSLFIPSLRHSAASFTASKFRARLHSRPDRSSPAYRGKARIAAGAPVYRESRWATISKSIELEVSYEPGSKRVYLLQIPGLSGAELFASVPLEFVELPAPLPVGP